MELDNRCPFCGGKDCERVPSTGEIWAGSDAFYFKCKKGFQCTIHPSVWYGDQKEVIKRFHQIYLKMKKEPFVNKNGHNYKYYFYFEEESVGNIPDNFQKINVAELMRSYPRSFMDKMEKSLYNLSREYPVFGWKISEERKMFHLLYCENEDDKVWHIEVPGILNALCELGYLSEDLSKYSLITTSWW